MKKLAACLSLALALFAAGAARAAEDYDPSAVPHDKASLMQLNDLQLGILRAAVRHCNAFYFGSRHASNFCVVTNTDRDIRQSNDAALKAFHFGLPPYDRYDEYRSWVGVNRVYGRRN